MKKVIVVFASFFVICMGLSGCKEDNAPGVPSVKKEKAFQESFWNSGKIDKTPSKGF